MLKKIIYPLCLLSGTIIGVGLFSLPYITSKVGIWIMAGFFLVLGSLVILVHLFFGELALKTPDFKRLPGFAKIYLGNLGEKIAFVSTILGLLGAILAYLIVGGEFLKGLLSPIFGGGTTPYTFLYFVLGAILIYFGIKAIAKVEFWGLILFFLILILIFFRAKNLINIENLFIENCKLKIENLFLPYGPILFSLWGAALIPQVEEMMRGHKTLFKKIIPLAILIPVLIYLFFIFLILGITGIQTSESALVGRGNFLNREIISLVLFFGILTTFTSFVALGLTLRNVFEYDLKIKDNLSFALTCFPPLILFLAGFKNFIAVISFVGAIALGIDGILILLMRKKIKPKRTALIYSLILILLVGIVYEIIYFVR
ncbi:MAG: aromatic amino acid transport family protein [Patescibacteria group bacterium]|nr:aromatic amino acid transport family protein [Patescibacteria group bacterium]